MRFVFTRAAFLGLVFALVSLAQQQLSVDQVVDFVTSSVTQKMADKDVADVLSKSRMKEKLDTRLVQDLQSKGAGPKTVAALLHLAEASATVDAAGAEGRGAQAETDPAALNRGTAAGARRRPRICAELRENLAGFHLPRSEPALHRPALQARHGRFVGDERPHRRKTHLLRSEGKVRAHQP